MRVAIVGAGLAGLAAGTELKELGHHVELFERSRLLGGRATSFEIDGIEVDNGQHVFLFCCKELLGFIERCNFEQDVYIQKRFEALVLDRNGTRGRLYASPLPAPLHLLPSFARYPHLSVDGKLKIAKALLAAMSTPQQKVGPLRGPSVEKSEQNSETFDQWLQRTGQTPETRRAFWDPFFIPALNAPFDQVSTADALFTLKTAFMSNAMAARFGYAKVPLAHLAANAAAKLDAVHLSNAVLAIESNASARSPVTLSLSKGDPAEFDAVVLAVPPRAVAKLLGDPQRYGVEHLDTYVPYPILDVHLWHDRGSVGFDFAAALDSPLQWIFEKSPGYLSCSFSAANESMTMQTADLEALAWREVQAFVPELRDAKLIRSAVTRNPEATWLPAVGAGRTQTQTNDPRVTIAGGWTDTGWPDTMESAVRSGLTAARLLATNVTAVAASETKARDEVPRHPEPVEGRLDTPPEPAKT